MDKKTQKTRILLINFEEAGIGSSGLLAAEALSRHPELEVFYLYSETSARSSVQRKRLANIPGRAICIRSLRDRWKGYLDVLYYCLKFRPHVVHDLCGTVYRKNIPLWPFFAAVSRLVMTEPVASPHDSGPLFRRWAGKMGYRLASKLVLFGPETYNSLLCAGMPAKKMFLSRLGHKGFYADSLTKRPSRDPNTILFFGEFRPYKGFEHLVSIADAVLRRWPQAKFIVAGSSHPWRYTDKAWGQTVDKTLSAMRAHPRFEVREEYVPDKEVADYFLRASMVILPYTAANQSGVLLTAMALNCPVIAAPVGDIPSVIRHERNGLLCSAAPESFAEAIISLLQNPYWAGELALQAKRDADEKFNWEKIVQEYPEKLYQISPRSKVNPPPSAAPKIIAPEDEFAVAPK